MRFALVTLLVGAIVPAASAQTVEDFRIDLAYLGTELPARHANAFAKVTPAQWDSALVALDARLPQLKRHESIVELMRVVALVRDGHTSLAPEMDARIGFHRLPIQLRDFRDGLHIVSADSAHADIVGAKVILIGPSSDEAAVRSATRLVSHESPNWARARAASLLAMPEVLAALGLSDDTLSAEFTLELDGRQGAKVRRTVRLRATAPAAGDAHGPPALPVDARNRTAGADPLYLQRPHDVFWHRILPDSSLYIRYRAVAPFVNGVANEQLFRQAFASGDSARVARVVLDIRGNGGGNNFMNRFVVREIIRRPLLDHASSCLVLIDRGVFSAAQNLVNELDYLTACTFVGEPTGNAPNMFGDALPLELPRTKFVVQVSSLYWQSHSAADARGWFQPDVYVELDAADYAAKRDPVLVTAVRRAKEPTLAARLAAANGDSAVIRSRIGTHRFHPENRYRNIEADINAAGYELLRSGQVAGAIHTFQRNTELFPRSGNTFDSLGEALEHANRKDEAIAAYKKALALEPQLFSSRDALVRLGEKP